MVVLVGATVVDVEVVATVVVDEVAGAVVVVSTVVVVVGGAAVVPGAPESPQAATSTAVHATAAIPASRPRLAVARPAVPLLAALNP